MDEKFIECCIAAKNFRKFAWVEAVENVKQTSLFWEK